MMQGQSKSSSSTAENPLFLKVLLILMKISMFVGGCVADLITQNSVKHTNRQCTVALRDDGKLPEVTLTAGRYITSC
jgi:PBP1b-binding outer membrane lipoprotein LpoB